MREQVIKKMKITKMNKDKAIDEAREEFENECEEIVTLMCNIFNLHKVKPIVAIVTCVNMAYSVAQSSKDLPALQSMMEQMQDLIKKESENSTEGQVH